MKHVRSAVSGLMFLVAMVTTASAQADGEPSVPTLRSNPATRHGFGSSPAVVGGAIDATSQDGNFYAFGAESRAEAWRVETVYFVGSSLAVDESIVYVGSNGGTFYALGAGPGS